MKVMLVSPEPSDYKSLQAILDKAKHPAENIFHYANPIKALDNIEELSPDIVFWNAASFPRHWKLLIPIYGISSSKAGKLVIFADTQLDETEIEKAEALGVADIIQTGISGPESQDLIPSIMPDMKASSPKPGALSAQYRPQKSDKLAMTMTHPLSFKLIQGQVLALSSNSLLFKPRKAVTNLPLGTIFKGCHLKIRDIYLELDMVLQHLGRDCNLVVLDPRKKYLLQFSRLVGGKLPAHNMSS